MQHFYIFPFSRRAINSFCFIFAFLLYHNNAQAQLTVVAGGTPASIVANLVGQGMTVSNIVMNCPTNAYGTFANGNTTNLGITNGILLTTGGATAAIGPNTIGSSSVCNGTIYSDPQLVAVEPLASYDPCILEFDIIPQCNSLTISFVFGSEEYPEFVNSSFNDAFGFFITGPGPACQPGFYNNTNVALLPNNITPVSIDNVNATNNAAYYVNNIGGATIQYDGFTTVLTRTIALCPCQTYHWKLAIADAGDCVFDSGVFVDFIACANALTLTETHTNAGCSGCTGTANVSLVGGIGPFTYTWSPAPGGGQGTANATGLCAGTYTCTVVDALSCSPASTIAVTIASTGTLTLAGSQTNVLCNGACTGSATTTIVTGTGPYSYAWLPSGGTGASATGLCAGTYTCTVTASGGCTAQQTFTITQPPALAASQTQTNVLCNGGATGAASVVVSGGTPAYTYNWTPGNPTGDGTANVTGLTAGTWSCTITDANGCTLVRTFTITAPPALAATQSQTNVLCFGGATGAASVVVSGGTPVYSYNWTPGNPTGDGTANVTGLTAGTWSCTITDANGCTLLRTFTITAPPALASTQTQTNVLCNGGSTGAASVVISGGSPAYTYNWTPGNPTGDGTANATGLTAGAWTCTATDANGCTIAVNFTLTAPPALAATQTQTNVLCNGGATGAASVVVSGGAPAYTYNWTPGNPTGDGTANVTGLTAGTWSCTVTDANGCTLVRTFTITAPPALAATQSQTNVLCNGTCTGVATVVASGGTSPYTYAWTPSGGTAASASALCIGTYTCTITDANGCTTSRTFTITQPTAIAATTSTTPATCGNPNGSASVIASGGVGPYTYSWAPSGGTAATATGLLAGSYTCTITDANGCTIAPAVTVINSGGPTASISTFTNVSCFGGTNGTATATMTGGTGPFTYAWSPSGGTGATGTGLGAGTYVVTVTDANGCVATATATITQPPASTLTLVATPVLCFGGTTGTAAATASGGTGPYTYNWTPGNPTGDGTANVTGLTAGTWSCTITDANGCTTTTSVVVTQPTAIASTGTQTNVLCNGGLTGSASVTASGGTGPYTYAWTPSGGTGSTATGLGAGLYTVTITDANGCTTTATTTVTEPTALAATTSFTQATCGSSNGAAAVVVSGGTAAYTYAWSPSGGTGSTATGLPANTYSCLITDANGCTMTATVVVPNAGSPTATITATTNVSCFGGNNGSATVAASGGTGPYTYAWTPTGGTGTTGTTLTAGNYTVTVTDANGCSTTATTVITQPPALAATATSSPVLCFGGTTGSATVTPTGGVAPYTYAWTPSGGTAATATGLGAGVYTATITDANGCTTTATTTVTQPTALSATATATAVLCFGGSTGSTSVTASGGTAGYTYNWAPTGGTGTTATGLIAGVYTVTVTDANGCTATATTTVTEPPVLAAITSFTQATCGSSNGSASVLVSGGIAAYTYAWSPSGGSAATATGLAANTYSCLISDANGCTMTATVVVPNANSPLVTIIASDSVSCFGGSDGFAAASSVGGTSPYTYLWSNADADTLAGNLVAGSYTVTVTDANGCTSNATITIGEPTLLTSTASSTDVLCFGGTTGTASATASGGTVSYTYNWAPSGGSASTATGLISGTYTVTITDANGCSSTSTTIVNEPPILTISATFTPVSCFGGANGATTSTATGGQGAYTYSWSPSGGTASAATGLVAGTYVIIVTDANGCTATASTTVTEPPVLSTTTSFTQATCNAANGSADVIVTGGIGAYTYLWSPGGATTATATGLTANTYSCLITDANGCTMTATVVVPNANAPVVTIAPPTMVTCFGGNDGLASASSTGGTSPYSYLWSNADADSLAGNLIAGSYTVTVTDANGCTSSATVLVIEPTLLNVQAIASPSIVCEGTPIQLTANAGGGTPAYTYVWTPGPLLGQTQNITPTATTTYTVTVADANGCTATSPVLVNVNPMPVAILNADVTSGCAPLCVNFTDNSTLASGVITGWNWDFGDSASSTQQNPSHCYTIPGNFTVVLVVTTSAGCTQTITMTNYIAVYAMPIAAFGAGPQPTTMLNPTVMFTDSSFNAASWLWSFGDVDGSSSMLQDPTFTYTEPDCYQIILEVTSPDGCIDTAMDIVCVGPDVIIYVPNTFTPDDNGLNDEFIPVTLGIDPDDYELWIFDRWGNMIFYSDELDEGWDGRVQGDSEICQINTYVWKIKCKDILDKKYDLIGHVNLIK